MNEQERELVIRRILVALDASTHSLAALEAAATLAATLEAELLGLFVEDINLLQLAGLPFAQEVSFSSATRRPLSSLSMEQDLRAQATRAQRALASAAERMRVRWSFRVVRGQVTGEVLAAALEADLLILGKISRPLTRRIRLGSTARAVIAQSPRSVLILQQGACIGQPVLVVYDGSTTARKTLAAAARLVQRMNDRLIVLIPSDRQHTAQLLEEQATEWLQKRGLQARYRRLENRDLSTLVQAVQTEGGGMLVVDGESALLQGEGIQELLGKIDCPILLVR
jgi:nucleotide-binding universal stress UspA family protein